MSFTLDTSGEVHGNPHIIGPDGQHYAYVTWEILSPFEQGYTAKMLKDAWANPEFRADFLAHYGTGIPLAFHHLASETLAAIRKDCAAALRLYRADEEWNTPALGAAFWDGRQNARGDYPRDGFPPLSVSLNDAGKVVFS